LSVTAKIAARSQQRVVEQAAREQAAAEPAAPKLRGKRERTRKKLLEAAFGLIGNEKGLTVRIEEICAAARVSRGTFYNYFTSLEQLFEALAIELSHDLNSALVSSWDETRSHAEGSNAAVQHYLNYARRDPAWAWAMVHLNAFGPTFGAESWDVCYRSIEQGIEAGEFDVPNATVGRDLMTGTVMASVRTMLRSGSDPSEPRIIAYHLLIALGVPHARAREITDSPLPDIAVRQ
jgi:AcrR family transcriptional regulator